MYINSVSSRAQEKQPWCKTLLYVRVCVCVCGASYTCIYNM